MPSLKFSSSAPRDAKTVQVAFENAILGGPGGLKRLTLGLLGLLCDRIHSEEEVDSTQNREGTKSTKLTDPAEWELRVEAITSEFRRFDGACCVASHDNAVCFRERSR